MTENIKMDTAPSSEGANPSVQKPEEEKKPTATLLGAISYDDESAYQKFLESLNVNHSVIILITAANYAQAKGVFSLAEAELIAKAIKRLRAESVPPDQSVPVDQVPSSEPQDGPMTTAAPEKQ